MKSKEFMAKYYFKNIADTKAKIKDSVKDDLLLIHCSKNIDELQKSANLLSRRLREWYSLYNPEFARSVEDNQKFAELICEKPKKELLKQIGVNVSGPDKSGLGKSGGSVSSGSVSMGADLAGLDVDEILMLSKEITGLYKLISKHEFYLEKKMKLLCPNMLEITGASIGAQLLEHAGSIKHLASMTASTIQLLGAEKALFRHLKTGARSPKHGLIIQHTLVQKSKDKGKAARALADKISMAVKVDYFKGEFIADRLLKELKDKLDA